MDLTLPCVRFVRFYDPRESRMVNLWLNITTQDQLANEPMAIELVVTNQTAEACMIEIRKHKSRWFDAETLDEIEKASKQLVDAQPSFYGVYGAYSVKNA
jgi:post-segregation antitoxin (ccd killing protein)